MGPWVTAMSAQASDMSAWLLMGLPGSILAFGLGQAWIGIGLALGTALNWILMARRLRRFSEAAGDSITLPQYLSNRFLTKNKGLQVTCAIVFLVCFTLYVASAFVAGTNVFMSLFDIDKTVAMLIFAAILILYTFLGGYKAVCWTDFFQGMLMLCVVLAVPIIIVITKDLDWSLLDNTVVAVDGTEYSFIKNLFAAPFTEIISGLAWGLGYFGMPHILVRFMAIEKSSMVKKSAIVAIVWVVLALVAVIFIALFGRMLISIYSSSPAVIEQGYVRLFIMMLLYGVAGMMDVMVGALRGIGSSVVPMIVSLIGVCGFRLIWIATVFQIPQFHTIEMVYLSYPISWSITLIAHVICYLKVIKKVEKQYEMFNGFSEA